ncbi:glycosyltransferase, group I [Aurantimonas manganoxydans SI85-9A1]|uniref:Glycosyltransferase, group I n=1 Tax=Aurantimonas manganoxydans (strain ATCC BAA-1229 / DSM 21871 / SI85-9A1) TaxID=287752 RepID=Q1YDI0_AURMS|nr:glycosyltransferase family 4 protein [Aurantimonas manganoxydans]EAS48317.1 glycosyltransferase, group I [Aurantimonas manganoxydans SI85-9A1]
MAGRIATIVKGYPRLSETFIAQEIAGLEDRGVAQFIVSLRQPAEKRVHPVHRRIAAEILYLPEYLKDDPARVRAGRAFAERQPGYQVARAMFEADLKRDPTANRHRRFGQACVLAHELPDDINWLHTHYLHTPASVTRYAATIRGIGWSFSAHAKDIWTSQTWELTEKLGSAAFGVTCTQVNLDYLQSLAPEPGRVELVYHGLDLSGIEPPEREARGERPFRIVSVGRTVEKKGFGDLIRALARLKDRDWTFDHVGGGAMTARLQQQADKAGIGDRITWHGSREREHVFGLLARSDLFVLPSRIARSGDRDGLPNVLMEAQAHRLPVVSTKVSAIPELVEDERTGLLVEPRDPRALGAAMARLMDDPDLAAQLATAGERRVRGRFSPKPGIDRVAALLKATPARNAA